MNDPSLNRSASFWFLESDDILHHIFFPVYGTIRSSEYRNKMAEILGRKQIFQNENDFSKPKHYCLDMFPYPSGAGLHVGHPKGFVGNDIYARYKHTTGYNILHPMGWDAFGLPAENYAIKTGVHPRITTDQSIANYKRQLKSWGLRMTGIVRLIRLTQV